MAICPLFKKQKQFLWFQEDKNGSDYEANGSDDKEEKEDSDEEVNSEDFNDSDSDDFNPFGSGSG